MACGGVSIAAIRSAFVRSVHDLCSGSSGPLVEVVGVLRLTNL
jgi:hypothetical protein